MSSLLFSPLGTGGLSLANRIVIPPMCQYSATDGHATDWHLMHYGSLSHSGAGLLIMEATAVTPEGRISPHDLGIWSDGTAGTLARLVAAIRRYASMPLCLQLAHAGRKASQYAPWQGDGVVPKEAGGWLPEAPSALQYNHGGAGGVVPKAMSGEDCGRIREAFAHAARRAAQAGFDAVEVHMAHGYLLHEFLSPLSNERDDAYGGTPENRMRYPLEVFDAIRAALPANVAAGVRISGSDFTQGGWDLENSKVFAALLQEQGCAYIHVSGGGLSERQSLSVGPGYQVAMAAGIKASLASSFAEPMPVAAVGLITQPELAESIVRSGQADLVAVGRAMLFDPRWPWRAAAALGASVTAPPQYWRAAPYGSKNLFSPL